MTAAALLVAVNHQAFSYATLLARTSIEKPRASLRLRTAAAHENSSAALTVLAAGSEPVTMS
jgi:hypothetical protein